MARSKRWQPPQNVVSDPSARKAWDDLADRVERGQIDIGALIGWDTALPTPDNRLVADGSTPLITDYPELFAVYGTTYGGNGTTTFGLPTIADTIIRSR